MGPLTTVVSACRAVLKASNRIWGNEVVMNYLKTGHYQAWIPYARDITFQEPDGRPGCDFFGVNHYARCAVRSVQ